MNETSEMLQRTGFQPATEEGLPQWYAVWTRSRHEKSVSEHLSRKDLETFLPLYSSIRRWKNGDHRVEIPLFPGYTFVRMRLEDHLQVLKVAGVVRLVGFGSVPTALGDAEVESLRRALGAGIRAEPHPYLTVGRRVRITAGPLAGREGLLVRWKSALRVVLSVDLIQRSILVDSDAQVLEVIA
jgi:transcription termination/antitermination protein NusG